MPRKSKKFNKEKLKKLLIILFIVGFFIYMTVGPYGIINIVKLKMTEMELRSKKEQLKKERMNLKDSIKLLKNDTAVIEKIAREKLGMIKNGDTIIIIEKENDWN